MKIISHRGYWQHSEEKNSLVAFRRSFDLGIGTETDLRDRNGRIAIAHDVTDKAEMYLEDLLELMDGRNLPLALNIKADGLASYVKDILSKFGHDNYFTFDMSVPDMLSHIRVGLKVFTGLSDIINTPVLMEKVSGIWLDSFHSDWFTPQTLDNLLKADNSVCVVSAELHKRDHEKQWQILKNSQSLHSDHLLLCTDHPIEAQKYFGVNA